MTQLTIPQTFASALQHHSAGQLQQAEQLYRQILAHNPAHADSIHHLGLIAHQVGRHDVAVDLIRRAISLNPANPQAHFNLGNVLRATGNLDGAITEYRQALRLRPQFPQALGNLGNTLADKGQLDEAIDAFRQTLLLDPNLPETHNNLGNALRARGLLDEALAAHRQACALSPGYADAHYNLANTLMDMGRLDESISAYQQAIALNPNSPDFFNNFGSALRERGRLSDAIDAFRRAIALNPQFSKAFSNLGNALIDIGKQDEAITAYRQAIAVDPDSAEAYNNLGSALREKGQIGPAIDAYQKAVAFDPKSSEAHSNLGNALIDTGRLEEAMKEYRQGVAARPQYATAHSSLIFGLHYHPGYDSAAIAEELRRWDRQHAQPLRKFIEPHANDRTPDRRLRVGFVSSDFRDHVVGRHLLPLFRHHDRAQFEFVAYAHVPRPDATTHLLQQNADQWHDIVGFTDEQLARKIRADKIDILVELSLHSADNRLLLFARKPAPVQVTYLGYPGSTGLTAIDYRLSDPHLDPPETNLACYSEQTVRLPHTYWCYEPHTAPDPAPILQNGYVTFGCLNNFAKVSPAALNLWAQILEAIPNSRLILHTHPGEHRNEILQCFKRAGVAKNRLTFVGKQPWQDYAQTYSQIDIALDPFPYGGGITTCDALWMGVPVVTLSGQTPVGRGGRSILLNLNLTDLIAFTPDQYLSIACDLARDRDRLQSLRHDLRPRMLASPLMNAPQFTRDVESAFRAIWIAWCKSAPQ